MDEKIIEGLMKIIPLTLIFQCWGMEKDFSDGVSTLIIIAVLGGFIFLVKYLHYLYKTSKTARQLAPYFEYQKVKESRRYFVPTRGQNPSPAHEDEPANVHSFTAIMPLIPFFMKTAFNEKKKSHKFYLILADSGMGKTTFMINLFIQYTSFLNAHRKTKIRLYPFSDSRILDEIKAISRADKLNTILLLDAFDEDKSLILPAQPDGITDEQRFHNRIDEIMEVVRDFREVVITSRTQFFPGQEDKPYELKIPRLDDKGFHILSKLYLSPFNDREIKQYLRKKYGVLRFWNWKKKKKAATIVKNSPKLMVRPMLLSYIDLLVDANKSYSSTYEIYQALVKKWLEREALKRKHKSSDRDQFQKELYTYSRLVALEIYNNRKDTNLYSLNKETAVAIACKNKIDLRDYEITGQSLLTRDADRNWKFAHRSIWEFLIAEYVVENYENGCGMNFQGMSMTTQFLIETGLPLPMDFVHIKGGTFMMGSPADEVDRGKDEAQHQVKVNNFYMAKYTVTAEQYKVFVIENSIKAAPVNKGQLEKNHPVVNVSWNDAVAYCQWLSKKLNVTFRLPTEAEWEYACRAGTTTPFNTGENLTTEKANYNGDYPYKNYPKGKYLGKTTPVGNYPPNGWGLYDMHGNVWEWCSDWYGEKYYDECKKQGITENPQGMHTGSTRVLRGGSWIYDAQYCRSAYRYDRGPDNRFDCIGFRLVFVPQSVGS